MTRGARFYLVAALLKQFGPPIQHFVEKRLELVMLAALATIIVGVLIAKYLF